MKLFLMTALMLGLAVSAGAIQKDTVASAASASVFDPQRNADADIHHAMAEAAASHRRILLDVGGNWCKWCKMLDHFFETNTDVAQMLHKNYVVVKVNFSKENENKDVLSRYPKIPGYPHFFVLKQDGSLLHSQDTGLLEKGQGYDPEKMKTFLTQWAK
jgi:thiol:disulfide interchange protein